MTMTFDRNATGDQNYAPCRCGLAKNEHAAQAYYADADDDPATELLAVLNACLDYLGSPANQSVGSYDGDIAAAGHLAIQIRAAITPAETAMANARVLSCKRGWDALQAALQPDMQFEELTRENAR